MTEHRTNGSWIRDKGYYRSVCVCGWQSPTYLYAMHASEALHAHIKDARLDARRPLARGFAHGSARHWPMSDGQCSARCICGWQSPMLDIRDARAAMLQHLEIAENSGPNHRNPDLPRLLRALASSTDAQANNIHPILTAAADELEFWRMNHDAQCVGGKP